MPLKSGSSPGTIQSNIAELMHKFTATGSIGTSHPASVPAAQKQAAAIAYSKAGSKGARPSKKEKTAATSPAASSSPKRPY